MPIMASHPHHSGSLPPSGYSSPIFDTRKRKQEVQYPVNPYYQQWRPPSNMQSSSDETSWNHDNSFLVMQSTFNSSDPQQQQFPNYEQETTIHSGNMVHDGGVGENTSRGLTEIHQMLSLDQFQSEEPSTCNFTFDSKRQNTLHLTDLGTENLLNQRQLLQSWSSTANANSYSNNGGSTTPGFFTPGFLESLQEESYPTVDFPFQNVREDDWSHNRKFTSVEHNTIMMPEVPQSNHHDSSFANLFAQQQSSMPSSPIPNTSIAAATAAAAAAAAATVAVAATGSSISSTSSTSSPPLTAVTSTSYLTNFDEKHRFIDHTHQRRTLQMNARLLQHAVNEAKMKPIIKAYLSNQYVDEEKTVIILTSKVAQKSYGTEKRFLCPPPTAILVGTNWWTMPPQKAEGTEILRLANGNELSPPRITVSISGETSSQPGQIEWYTVSGATVGQTGHPKSQQQSSPSTSTTSTASTSTSAMQPSEQQPPPPPPTQQQHPSRFRSSAESRHNSIDWYHNHAQELLGAGKCVSKHLFINDADEKRKRVEGLIRIQLANGIQLGTLASKGIKVISKPSKKRQSVKNMELCIHHGTTVSLFNRIRSQTVSTKYLGVSSSSSFPGQPFRGGTPGEGTCFVARTTCWDPFVIWVVDTAHSSDAKESDTPEDFIGRNAFCRNIPYPPPPAIALKNKTSQLIPIHYNQHVVLQCLTTGLVSPVMIIRKVDKASTVVGGAQTSDDFMGGGEYGDEVLGDPVSQLHKVALQIVQDPQPIDYFQHTMMPRTSQPVTYLACLNDMVGMHKTTEPRKPIHPPKNTWDDLENLFDITSQEGGKIVRKRRVSTDPIPMEHKLFDAVNDPRRRVNSLNDDFNFYNQPHHAAVVASRSHHELSRKSSVSSNGSTGTSGRRSSVHSQNNQLLNGLGAYWHEDVSDAAVWTIVGTDCATYTFLSPNLTEDTNAENEHPPTNTNPFPSLINFTTKSALEKDHPQLSLHGENFSRDLQVWFGHIKATGTEYRSRELLICRVPSRAELLEYHNNQIPILLVRGDGTICKTNKFYQL